MDKKIDCIESFYGSGTALHLNLASSTLLPTDLDDLVALFTRYGIDTAQLQQYAPDNTSLVASTHMNVYPAKDRS